MIDEQQTIPRNPVVPKSMDYRLLKREGIEHAQKLAGQVWTDYNSHDPGVTILEQLCFTMTELAYKTRFPVKDILFAKAPEPFHFENNALFPGYDVFPCSPITPLDYRRLIIDQSYPYIKNAWLLPLNKSDFGINMSGLYGVRLLVPEEYRERQEDIRHDVFNLLSRYRNLCEDFENVRILNYLPISVRGNISLNPNYLVENVMSEVMFNLSQAITPTVRFESRDDLEEQGLRMDEIFDGPLPIHGFVNLDDLRRSGIQTLQSLPQASRLINNIRNIRGVEEVRNFEVGIYLHGHSVPDKFVMMQYERRAGVFQYLNSVEADVRLGHTEVPSHEVKAGFYQFEDSLIIPDGYCPNLDVDSVLEQKLINVTVDGLPYSMDNEVVKKSLDMMMATNIKQYQHPIKYEQPRPQPTRSREELQEYYSLQHTFPTIYGVTEYGVPSPQTPKKVNYAKQLKAYLFFFEQLLADYLAQLTHFHFLFSLNDGNHKTYYHQLPVIPNEHWIMGDVDRRDEFQEKLEAISKRFDPVAQRRERFLDHLLARFGEEFLSETYNAINKKAIAIDDKNFEEELLKAKEKYLHNIREIGRYRGKGFDYKRPPHFDEILPGDGSDGINVSVLQKKISLLFNMHDYSHRSLTALVNKNEEINLSKGMPEEVPKDKGAFTFIGNPGMVMADVLRHGIHRDNYQIGKDNEDKNAYAVYFQKPATEDDPVEGRLQKIFRANSYIACEKALLGLIPRIREINNSSEGFHLIEHVLLRPVGPVYPVPMLIKAEKVLLFSSMHRTSDTVGEFSRRLIKFGKKAGNYNLAGSKEEGFILELKDDDDNVLARKGGFLVKKSAMAERKEIMDFLQGKDERRLEKFIQTEEQIPSGALLPDDFYSRQVSVLVPSWPARFRSDKIRSLFEQTIKLSAPAHVIVDVHWVDFPEMSDFENLWEKWLQTKATKNPRQPLLDRLSFSLLIMLKYFRNPGDPLVNEELPAIKNEFGLSMKFK